MLERFLSFLHSNVALFGGIGGAVITLALLRIENFFARPRLVLSFDESSDAYMASSTHSETTSQSLESTSASA